MDLERQLMILAHTNTFTTMAQYAYQYARYRAIEARSLAQSLWATRQLAQALRIRQRAEQTCDERQEALLQQVYPPEMPLFRQIWP